MKDRKIGLEYEFLAIQLENGQAITRDIIKAIWREWSKQDNVELYFDYGTKQPVGVMYTQEDGREFIINTDAAVDIIEFGFLPFSNLEDCEENMRNVLKDFLAIAKKHNVGLLDIGLQPKTPHTFPDLKSEKIWYRLFNRFPHFAQNHQVFYNIAAHQACIDIEYNKFVAIINTFNSIGGIIIALFANTGVGEWKIQDFHETREHRWDELVEGYPDSVKKIRGIPKKPFESFKDYLSYNWSVVLPGVHRDKTLHTIDSKADIEEYLRGKKWDTLDVGDVEPSEVIPDITDVNLLNMYIWIQARPKFFFDEKQKLNDLLAEYDKGSVDEFAKKHLTKFYLETRNIASQPWEEIMSAPAFLLGLIENIEPAKELSDSKPWKYWIELREKTIKKSLEVDEVIPLAEKLLQISREGLEKRGLGEEKYLQPLYERLEKRESPAMKSIKDFEELGMDKFIESRLIKI